jgi:predicted DNA-binding protein with PD1-like motif
MKTVEPAMATAPFHMAVAQQDGSGWGGHLLGARAAGPV